MVAVTVVVVLAVVVVVIVIVMVEIVVAMQWMKIKNESIAEGTVMYCLQFGHFRSIWILLPILRVPAYYCGRYQSLQVDSQN